MTIKRIRIWSRRIGYVFAVILASNPLLGYSSEAASDKVSFNPETITVIVGESTIIKTPWPTVRVAVTDPKIADVQVLTRDQVLLQGIKVGSTDLILWSEGEKQVSQRKVLVNIDTARFKEKLDELFPLSSLEVNQSNEVLIVKGLLRTADQVTQLHSYLDKIGIAYVDMTSVAGVQQVQLQVRVAEVSRSALRALGINAFHTHTNDDYFVGTRIGGAGVSPISIGPKPGTAAGDTTDFVFGNDVTAGTLVTIFAGFPKSDFEIFLQALAENHYLRILANPTLVALSGEDASFLAGGEFPVPVPQGGAGIGGIPTITIQYKKYGVQLDFRPTVLGDGSIRLFVSPEVSEISTINIVKIVDTDIPSLNTRKAQTTLELKSGQTFAIAGLLKHNTQALNARIPGLGDIPVLGPLFRSVRYTEDETELVILVTASLVEPMSVATVPPLPGFLHARPTDWELYLEGRIEGKEPAKIDSSNAQWLKKIGLGGLLGPGAWDSYDKPIFSSKAETAPNATDTKDIATLNLESKKDN